MNRTDFLFEISYEVCNKVGGIYTVITSKAKYAKENFKNYYLIGPYLKNNSLDFIETAIPQNFQNSKDELEKLGIKIHFGYFNIEGKPNVILVEYLGYSSNINDIKFKLWDLYKIDSLNSYWYDFDEAILWSWCCGIVIEKLTLNNKSKVFVHCHEWMAGGAIFYLKSLNLSKYKTIFTTHATILGRTICGIGENLYKLGENYDFDKKSYELKVHTKHQSEKSLANISDCFTTVSDITGQEAKYLYKKSPQVLLYNGFDNFDFDTIEKMNIFRKRSKNKMNLFLEKYFKNYYKIDLSNTLIFYTSGRNEFHNKGVDLYIKSLGILNEKLKKKKSSKTIINLFLIPIGNFEIDRRFLEDSNYVGGDFAPLFTHRVPESNEIMKAFKDNNLLNHKDDKVKVILMPFYLDGNDQLFNMKYYDAISGFDLGVFPSFYEPWGYTPLESIAYGVPTITSDLAGFARAVDCDFRENNLCVSIIKREGIDINKSVKELAELFEDFSNFNDKKLQFQKENAIVYVKNFSWENFYQNYLKAYEIASKK